MDTLITVITPCYNSEKTISKTIESVLNQTYKNIEYIIIDGASNDGTLDIVRKFEPLFEGRMRIVSEKDTGIYNAMNKGIRIANGEMIGIVSSNDYYEPKAVELMVSHMTDEPYQVLYGFQRCLTNDEEDKVVLFNHRCLDRQMITHPTCFITRKAYEKLGVYAESYRSSADYELMLRWFHGGKVHFQPVYSIISNFESGGISSTDAAGKETLRLRREYGIIGRARYYLGVIHADVHSFYVKLKRPKKNY